MELCLLFKCEVESALKFESQEDLQMIISDIIECRYKEIDNFSEFYHLAVKIYQLTEREASNLGSDPFKIINVLTKIFYFLKSCFWVV